MKKADAALLFFLAFAGAVMMGYYGMTGAAPWWPEHHDSGCPKQDQGRQ